MSVIDLQSVPFYILGFLALLYLIVRREKKGPRGLKRLPGPRGVPLLGAVLQIPAKHLWLKFTQWADEYGPIFQVKLGADTLVILSDPKIVDDLLVKRQHIYSSRHYMAAILNDNRTSMEYLPLMTTGPDHSRAKLFARRLMSSIPSSTFSSILTQRTKHLIRSLISSPSTFQIQLERCTAGISSQLAWSNDSESVALDTLQRAHELVVGISPEAIENKMPFLRSIPEWVPNWLQPWKVEEIRRWKHERAFWIGERDNVRREINKGEKEVQYSWTAETLKMSNPTLDEKEQTYSVGMLALIGGMLVASPLQSWVLAMCHYPEWQERGQAEVDTVCGDRMPDIGDIERMPVVRALIRETFRWRSPVPFGSPHCLDEDDEYEGYRIPKGSQVLALDWALSRDSTLYPDPESYNPGRWLDPAFPTYREPLTRYPGLKNHSSFGFGKRACIGQEYTETVNFTIVACILWSCNIQKKRDSKTGEAIYPPWLEYGPNAIVRPISWEMDVKSRSEKRFSVLGTT